MSLVAMEAPDSHSLPVEILASSVVVGPPLDHVEAVSRAQPDPGPTHPEALIHGRILRLTEICRSQAVGEPHGRPT
jgi:hypothetical protein